MGKIVVIGSSNTDLVVRTERIPAPGETVLGGEFVINPGGKGANQAVAVARLGGDVSFIAKVGNDDFGRHSVEGYQKDGLNTELIFVDQNNPSGVALIAVDAKGENSIVVASGANMHLSVEDIKSVEDEIIEADYLLMQLESPMEVIEYAATLAHQHGTKVILNPAPAVKLSETLLSKLYLLTPNEIEASLIVGCEGYGLESAPEVAKKIHGLGVENVVITLGSKGSYVYGEGFDQFVEANKVEAIDTTAAGDTFNGALSVALSEGKSLIEAVKFASKASAISVTRVGAQASIPYRQEIK